MCCYKELDEWKKWRFPLFTGLIFMSIMQYKLAYEFVKAKGLMKEFVAWQEAEGIELVKTFFKEGLQMIEEQEEREKKNAEKKDCVGREDSP